MYNNDLTYDTTVFSLTQERPTSSIRRDATRALDNPYALSISHETAKSGRISSVVLIDDELTVTSPSGDIVPSLARVQFKISYNPDEGRTDLTTVLEKGVAVLQAYLASADGITKLLNQEH